MLRIMTPEEVRNARERLGLSQRDLAREWKLGRSTVWRYEQYGAPPHIRDAFRGLAARLKSRKMKK